MVSSDCGSSMVNERHESIRNQVMLDEDVVNTPHVMLAALMIVEPDGVIFSSSKEGCTQTLVPVRVALYDNWSCLY